jgi:uncharacterized membrane protein
LGTAEEIPCSEGEDDKVYGVIRNVAYPIINGQVSNWDTKENQFHYYMVHGHSQEPFDPVAEINALLFGAGQQGTFIAPTWSQTMIGGNSFGTGVQNILDLSPRNNPFSQATPSSRGAWFREPKRGRVNEFEQTEDFGNAYWTKSGGAITDNTSANPLNGGLTADRFTENSGAASNHGISRSYTSLAADYTASFYFKPSDLSFAEISFDQSVGTTVTTVNLATGSTVAATGVTVATTLLADGWVRVAVTATLAAGTRTFRIRFSNTSGSFFYSGNGTRSLDIFGAQLELGSTATPYQRVTTAFDVTESGQRDCYGVRADGTDDFYTTASTDFTGTDKVTVFAAVRKLSDAARAVLLELSTTTSNPGTFSIEAPPLPAQRIDFFNTGTTSRNATITGAEFAAGLSLIVTGIGDIAAPITQLRVNGVVRQTNSSSLGTGNYSSNPLYLFRRGGTTLPFNGDLYALIVAGGSYPLSTIQRVERLLSRITPVNL